jgi:transposase-like protein
MTAELQNPMFTDANVAREALEAVRWPNGPVCVHCGSAGEDIARLEGKSGRPGLFYCNGCKGQFTVTVGTVFERSKIPLNKWWLAAHLLNSSKKGISAHQMHRMLGVTYKSAWFMMHRLREAMRTGGLEPMGGAGKIVEADETYFGSNKTRRASSQRAGRPYKNKRGLGDKRPIVSLVERGGKVRSFHVAFADGASVAAIVNENVAHESRLHTDESRLYIKVGENFAAHETVNHSADEYARGDVTTNSVEGYFSIFKRGMKGVYQHCGEKHLHRYLAEFDFRFNSRTALGFSDGERAALAMKGAEGKRLTYR